jgi:hypothetical protein
MPLITPIATNPPTTGPATLTSAQTYQLGPADGIDITAGITAASAVLRPFFWQVLPASIRAAGGQWCPLGGDGAVGVGTSPVTVDAASYGGAVNGRYLSRVESRWWIVVAESGTPDWVAIEAVTRFREG